MTIDSIIAIRPATSADIPALLAVQHLTSTSAQWTENQYRDFFSEGPRRLILVAESSSRKLLGFLVAQHIPPEWELENIVVAPELQRQGIGRRLLAFLIEAAKRTNSDAVFLEVRESNLAARGLYENCGFQQTGRRKSYYNNPLEDAILYHFALR